jgi:ubiquinone/menaquinone biosynthesis C-methylase UbiE
MASPPPLTPLAAAVLHVGNPERILEVECGGGEGTLFLAREFPSARVRGIDCSEKAIHAAAARVGLDPEGRIAFKQGEPRDIPFPDDQFDLVTALDTRPSPAETARVLRPGRFLALAITRGEAPLAGLRGVIYGQRLSHRGFEPIWEEPAGAGSFLVTRLRGGGPIAEPY